MGHDHQQSSSSGAVAAIVVGVLLFAILGILVVAGAGLFFVRADRMESRAQAIEHRMVTEVQRANAEEKRALVELHRAEAEIQRTVAQVRIKDGVVQIQESRVADRPDSKRVTEVKLDRAGIASIDGEVIELDELRAQLAKLKDETSSACSVQINADSECPVKHVISVLDVCKEVGDFDVSIASSQDADSVIEEE
jgi:biopolymer transport protein ExbD